MRVFVTPKARRNSYSPMNHADRSSGCGRTLPAGKGEQKAGDAQASQKMIGGGMFIMYREGDPRMHERASRGKKHMSK